MKTTTQRILALLLTLLLLFSLSACSGASLPDGPAAGDHYEESDSTSEKNEPLLSSEALPADRILIKTVDETIETLEYDTFLAALKEAVAEAGGYFSSSHYRNGSYSATALRTATLTIRIPAAHLTDFCDTVAGLAHVTYASETIDDITSLMWPLRAALPCWRARRRPF